MRAPRWYKPDKTDDDERQRAIALLAETAAIEQRQSAWYELGLWNATLYSNRELIGFRWGSEENVTSELWPKNLRTENLIENIGQAMLSKASSSPLKPSLVPLGASWKTERDVRLADKFLFGVWQQTQAEDACVQMFNDAYTCGLGCVQVAYDDNANAVHVESVFFDNIVIDNRECGNRASPKTYRIRKVVPLESVEAQYGVAFNAEQQKKRYTDHRPCGLGWGAIVEAWRLPDANGKGGRHSVACCDMLLVDEPWTNDWVPLVFFHWQDRQSGFFTKGGVEQVIPFQVIQNDLNDDIKDSQTLACRALIALNANSQTDVSQIQNKAMHFLMYSGMKPEPMVFPSNLGELYNERERNKAAAYSHMGLSEMFANADMPQQVRLDSSAGVREFRNMEDARHLRLWTKFEASRLQVARAIMNVLSVSSGASAFTTMYHPGGAKASSKNIPYEAIKHLTEEQFSWSMNAIPLSQMSPAVRREVLRDFSSRGLIKMGTDEARRMESNPNLERVEDFELISSEDIDGHLEELEAGRYRRPNELTNLSLGVQKVTANYQRLLRYEDVDENSPMMRNHIKWIVAASSIIAAAAQPPQMAQGPMTAFSPTQGVAGTYGNTAQG